jgi:hypothetical protein
VRLEILCSLVRIPSELHGINVRVVRPLSSGCLTVGAHPRPLPNAPAADGCSAWLGGRLGCGPVTSPCPRPFASHERSVHQATSSPRRIRED